MISTVRLVCVSFRVWLLSSLTLAVIKHINLYEGHVGIARSLADSLFRANGEAALRHFIL